MKIQSIRHATLIISIKDKKILVDPVLSKKGTMRSIPKVLNPNNNPLVELPIDIDEIINVDAVLLTHTHYDHFDDTAIQLIPKHIPIFCQPEDEDKIKSEGFLYVTPIKHSIIWNDITFIRTKGQHGDIEMSKKMGPVSGFILSTNTEPSVYIMGDTIWYSDVEKSLATYSPEIIISYGGSAQFDTGNPITMTSEDIYNVCKKSPNSKVIVVHMEAWNHCLLSRKELKDFLIEKSLDNQVYVPDDGEIISNLL